jgi:hypothetical protein
VVKGMIDIQPLSLEVQAAYVALFRIRAALACPSTVTEYRTHDDGPMLAEREAVAFVSALPTPAALSGTIEGSILRLEARAAAKEASPLPDWSVPEKYGPDSAFRAVALEAKEGVLVAHAAAVERSFQEYRLKLGGSVPLLASRWVRHLALSQVGSFRRDAFGVRACKAA